MIPLLLLLGAVWLGATVLALALCRGASDAHVVDLAAQRRLRALGEAARRHPSSRGGAE